MSGVDTQSSTATSTRRIKFRCSVLSDVGLRRSENQDAYGMIHSSRGSLFVVADGMGGARGGATASALAVNVIVDGGIGPDGVATMPRLRRAIAVSNNVIFSKSQEDRELTGMGTTVVALSLTDKEVLVAHVGDSRIYQLRGKTLMRLTRDHTLVQELVDTGAIPEEDAASHPIAHMLTRSLGPAGVVDITVHPLPDPPQPGDRFLLCSDGLYNHVEHEDIEGVLGQGEPEQAAAELVKRALDGGGSDNVTVLVIEVRRFDDESISDAVVAEGSQLKRELSSVIKLADFEALAQKHGEAPCRPGSEDLGNQTTADTVRLLKTVKDTSAPNVASANDDTLRLAAVGEQPSGPGWRAVAIAGVAVCLLFLVSFYALQRKPAVGSLDESSSVHAAAVKQNGSVVGEQAEDGQKSAKRDELSGLIGAGDSGSDGENGESDADRAIAEGLLSSNEATKLSVGGISSLVENSQPQLEAISEMVPLSDEVASVIAVATDLTVLPPPVVRVKGDNKKGPGKAVEPIVWERENVLVEKILSGMDVSGKAAAQDPGTVVPASSLLRTDDEKHELADEKEKLRGEISDIDAKLQLLACETREEAGTHEMRIESELADIEKAIEAVKLREESASDALKTWLSVQKRSADVPALKLIPEVAPRSALLRAKSERYDQAVRNYSAAVERWKEKQSDAFSASTMAALGREVNIRRSELEASLGDAIELGVEESRQVLAEVTYFRSRLEQRRNRLNRHAGFFKGFIGTAPERRTEELKRLTEGREKSVAALTELQQRLGDELEIAYRKAASSPE